jgi:hypothetical protein
MARWLFVLALVLALPLVVGTYARAVSIHGTVKNVPYVIAFRPLNSQKEPYVGQMHLNFTNGIIQGTYTDISTKPGSPFANAFNLSVSGGVSSTHVTLIVRQVTFKGTASGETMKGSANIRGGIYEWEAHQGSPGSGKH